MNERPMFMIPSCSNQIESMHGHLNALVPRRIDFFHSLKRLIDFILKKNYNLNERFAKNYQAHKWKINNILKHLPNDILQSQILHYETNLETKECKCSDSIPCSHLVHMNVEFSSIEPPKIQLQNEFQSELIYEFKIHKSKKIVTDSNYYSRIRNSAANSIHS